MESSLKEKGGDSHGDTSPEEISKKLRINKYPIGDVGPNDDWEDDNFKELKRLMGMNFDVFNYKGYYPIIESKDGILSLLDRSLHALSELYCVDPDRELEVYFSTVSRYCGLLKTVKKAAELAVNRYNQRMGKSWSFLKVRQANSIWSVLSYLFFITLDVIDTSSGVPKTFQTCVYFPHYDVNDCRDIWNFKLVRLILSENENLAEDIDEEEGEGDDNGDGWETESFKNIEKSLDWDVFGDPNEHRFDFRLHLSSSKSGDSIAEAAKNAVDLYNEKKGGKLDFVDISRINVGCRFSAVLYYMSVKTIDTSTGVERTFVTNILAGQGDSVPVRVRAFKPAPLKELREEERILEEEAIGDEDDGWQNWSFEELTNLIDFDCFDDNCDHLIETVWIMYLFNQPLNLLRPKDKREVQFSLVSHDSALYEEVIEAANFAVERYNEVKGRSLKLHKVSKANYISYVLCHFFFITIEAVDSSSSTKTKRTFQTSVFCPFKKTDCKDVWSFKLVKELNLAEAVVNRLQTVSLRRRRRLLEKSLSDFCWLPWRHNLETPQFGIRPSSKAISI